MNSILEKWGKDIDLKKWFKKDNLIVLILVGVLLVIIALPTRDGGETETEDSQAQDLSAQELPADKGETTGSVISDAEYAGQLEQRLREILTRMEGVGKVRVMITLKSSQELVVEKEQPYLRSSTNEGDAQGGTRSVNQLETEENTVYRTDGSVSEPYVIKTLPPQIEGVVVVAEGAGSGTVDRTIVEMIQALFGVEAHKVKVVKMESAE
ncbi:MAG: stage III sporulation protein AG [Lachnospiraceae bacterium]|nr:stage III sporulation protein AG [Lachnospiraceae bacterium]MCM1239586.1 stage III sporulation protein AG [Lachnospiraceae bacterium]